MKIGAAFPDYIRAEKTKSFFQKGFGKAYKTRDFLLPLLLVAGVSLLFIRLFFLQLLQGSYYRGLSDGNRIKTVTVHAPRGIIFDRNGIPLVFNAPGFRQTPPAGGSGETKLLTQDEALSLLVKGEKKLEIDSLRKYPYKEIFSHSLGYISQISKEELGEAEFKDYQGGDLIGKMGIEGFYEATLKGKDGKELLEVDSLGNEIRKLGKSDFVAGTDIALTLDLNLQKAAFSAMQEIKKGAVVVSTPNGEILTLLSKPSFDPNLFTLGERYSVVSNSALQKESAYTSLSQVLSDAENQPILNRAIAGTYPPGSTFKLIVAAAGLENKIIDESFEVEDSGVLTLGAFSFANWYYTGYGKTEGVLNLVKAIKRSNDIFFYKLAEKIGVSKISETAKNFGVGNVLGIDLEGEKKGTLPTPQWKEETVGEKWYLGDTYNYGIGQGYLLTTPLQVNMWTQAIANGGTIYMPRLLKNSEFRIQNLEFLSKNTVDLIRQGMIETCSPGGVAWPLFEFKIQNSKFRIDNKNFFEVPQSTTSAAFRDYRKVSIACKTGTAEHGGKETLPHAWITLLAPAQNPQIIITVLAEESGEGSNIAAPIAKKILEEWFGR